MKWNCFPLLIRLEVIFFPNIFTASVQSCPDQLPCSSPGEENVWVCHRWQSGSLLPPSPSSRWLICCCQGWSTSEWLLTVQSHTHPHTHPHTPTPTSNSWLGLKSCAFLTHFWLNKRNVLPCFKQGTPVLIPLLLPCVHLHIPLSCIVEAHHFPPPLFSFLSSLFVSFSNLLLPLPTQPQGAWYNCKSLFRRSRQHYTIDQCLLCHQGTFVPSCDWAILQVLWSRR